MNKTRMVYFESDDVLHLSVSDEPEASCVELSPTIMAELNSKGQLIGIEFLGASEFIRSSVLDSVRSKVPELAEPETA
jgi:uncharacterized protein YuzE